MEIDISKYLARGEFTGNFGFNYSPEQELCIIPLCNIEGDVKVSGPFEIYDDDCVGINLKIVYLIVGKCSYCLSDAQKLIEFESEVLYVPEKNDDDYFYDGRKVNLKTAVDEAILISQPSIILCKDGCEGIVVK